MRADVSKDGGLSAWPTMFGRSLYNVDEARHAIFGVGKKAFDYSADCPAPCHAVMTMQTGSRRTILPPRAGVGFACFILRFR